MPNPEYEKIIKDPYVLEFLDLPQNEHFYESELEQALIDHLQKFLLEFGKGFSFVARQKHFNFDGRGRIEPGIPGRTGQGKLLKTRDSGTLAVAGIPCLFLELCLGSMRAAVTSGHSGHKSDPSVTVLTPLAVNVTPVVTFESRLRVIDLSLGYAPRPGAITLASRDVLVSGG